MKTRVHFDWGQVSIDFKIEDLPMHEKRALLNYIQQASGITWTAEQEEKLDEWIRRGVVKPRIS